jgi:hypothetical protein
MKALVTLPGDLKQCGLGTVITLLDNQQLCYLFTTLIIYNMTNKYSTPVADASVLVIASFSNT